MNAERLQMISILFFLLFGILSLTAGILFFRLKIRVIIDDLNGKTAERQIRQMREQNRQGTGQRNAVVPYERASGRKKQEVTENAEHRKLKNAYSTMQSGDNPERTALLTDSPERTAVLTDNPERTVLLTDNPEQTVLLTGEPECMVSDENGAEHTEQLQGETDGTAISDGCFLLVDEVIVHTKERI